MRLGYFSADDLAALFATTHGYVLKKASQGAWGRIHHPTRGKLYRFEDAERDLGPGATTRRQERNSRREQEDLKRLIAQEQEEERRAYGDTPWWR